MRLLVAMVAVAGCGLLAGCRPTGDFTPLPRQLEAMRIIWSLYSDLYGGLGDMPDVYWRRDRCGEPDGLEIDDSCSFDSGGVAVAGVFYDFDYHIEVAAPSFCNSSAMTNATCKISVTALPHEMLHAAQRQHGIDDQMHSRREWEYSIPVVYRALTDAGL